MDPVADPRATQRLDHGVASPTSFTILVGIGAYFASLGSWITMLQGAIFIVVVLGFRRGICGWLEDRFQRPPPSLEGEEAARVSAPRPTYTRR